MESQDTLGLPGSGNFAELVTVVMLLVDLALRLCNPFEFHPVSSSPLQPLPAVIADVSLSALQVCGAPWTSVKCMCDKWAGDRVMCVTCVCVYVCV